MNKLLILVVAAAAGIGGWRLLGGQSEAYVAYEKFADAMLDAKWSQAEAMASGEVALAAIEYQKSVERMMGGNTYQNTHFVCYSTRKVESETVSQDGKTVTLQVVQDCRMGSPTMAPAGPPTVRFKQKVVVVKTDAGWKIDSYEEETEPLTKNE